MAGAAERAGPFSGVVMKRALLAAEGTVEDGRAPAKCTGTGGTGEASSLGCGASFWQVLA